MKALKAAPGAVDLLHWPGDNTYITQSWRGILGIHSLNGLGTPVIDTRLVPVAADTPDHVRFDSPYPCPINGFRTYWAMGVCFFTYAEGRTDLLTEVWVRAWPISPNKARVFRQYLTQHLGRPQEDLLPYRRDTNVTKVTHVFP